MTTKIYLQETGGTGTPYYFLMSLEGHGHVPSKAWILEIPITKPIFEKGHQCQSSNAIFSCFYMFDSRWAMGMQICTNLC